MIWSRIPIEQIKAISRGAPGFHKDLARRLQEGQEPQLHVIRLILEGCEPSWFLYVESESGSRLFGVDKSNIDTMAALVPIFLVEFVQHVRAELPEVFAIAGFERGIEMLVPLQRKHSSEKPS
jgi:hypothetical protein